MKTFQNTRSEAPSSEQILFLDHNCVSVMFIIIKDFFPNTTCFTIKSIKKNIPFYMDIRHQRLRGLTTPQYMNISLKPE